jgi:hypothetical protein
MESDGDTDLMVAAFADGTILVFQNDGVQNFSPTTLTPTGPPADLVAVDVDGDSDLDIVVAGSGLEWFQQMGANSGSFSSTPVSIIPPGTLVRVFAADLDADGDADLMASDTNSSQGRIFLNDGAGSFSLQAVTGGDTSVPDGIAAGDMDADGDLDAVVNWHAGSPGRRIRWYEQTGINSGVFRNLQNKIGRKVDGPRGLFVDDVDGDGVADLLVYVANVRPATVPTERIVLWYGNDGTGSSFSRNPVQISFGDFTNDGGSICLADIDGDGLKDVVAAPDNDTRISWWPGSSTAGAVVANSTALPLGWIEECARTWDGSAYALIAPESGAVCSGDTTPLGLWEGFWVLADQEVDLVIPPRPGLATGNITETLAGIPAGTYDLIGVPLDPSDGDAGAVVGDDLGGVGAAEVSWRVAKYNVTTEAYDLYTGPATLPDFTPGRGFWLIHDGSVADPATIDVGGSELAQVVGSPPFNGGRVMLLSKPGPATAKHMLANPFDYAVEWGSMMFRRPLKPGVGTQARRIREAAPHGTRPLRQEGALPGDLARASLILAPRAGLMAHGRPSDRRWLLEIHVASTDGRIADRYNRLGVVPGSRNGKDHNDALDLAPFGAGWVRLYFPHDDRSLGRDYWRRSPSRLTNDIRRPRLGRMAWTFAVESDLQAREWVLSWPTLSQLPAGIRLTLTDLESGLRVDPAFTPEYLFRMDSKRRLFRLEVDARALSAAHGSLHGVVRDGRGRPTRSRIEIRGPAGYRHTVTTDGRGRYRLRGLDPGLYTVTVPGAGGLTIQAGVQVRAGKPAHLNLKLEPSGP